MRKKYDYPLTEAIVNKPIATKGYNSDKVLTYDDVLTHLYKQILQKYIFAPFNEETSICIENDVYDTLRKVINNDIKKYIRADVYAESYIHGTLDVKYTDIDTNKEVTLYELYKYTPDNLHLLKYGYIPINKAL